MTDNNQESVSPDLVQSLEQSVLEGKQLETILVRLLQVLTDNGFQVSVDVVSITRGLHQRMEALQKSAQALNSQVEQMERLLRTFTLITSTLDLEQVLDEVMDTVISFTGAERAYLVLRDKKTKALEIAVARNWDRESLSGGDAVYSSGVVQRALREKQTIITTDAATDDRFQDAKSIFDNQLRSILCIPLIIQAEAVGVLYADNRMTQGVFRPDEIPLLTAFGTQAAIAIENARLYGQVKDDLNKALSELQSLQIQIDKAKLEKQVSQITETDYFQRLSASARTMRGRYGKTDYPEDE